jgi:hypothetical protein
MIHSLQIYGLESDRVTFWGAFSDDQLAGILFADNDHKPRYGCLASDDPEVLTRLGEFALASGIKMLVGKSTYIQPAIKNLYSRVQINVKYYHFYQVHPEQLVRYHDYPVRVATEDDIPLLVEFYRGYEFRRSNITGEETEHEIQKVMDESGRYFVIELEGRAVSGARIVAETDRAGVIDAARTLPEFRGRSMYPSVRTACFEYLFEQGKTGLGFFRDTNTNMFQVINKQGGNIIATWLIVDLLEKPPLRRRIFPLRLRRWGLSVKDRIWR